LSIIKGCIDIGVASICFPVCKLPAIDRTSAEHHAWEQSSKGLGKMAWLAYIIDLVGGFKHFLFSIMQYMG
jgi:hypothetical protein